MSHPFLANLPQGWVNHGERIIALLEALRPMRCVEVGTWRGASAIVTARVIRQWGGCVTCVDTFASGPEGASVMLDEWRVNIKEAGVEDVVDVIVCSSLSAAASWDRGPIDYCYIDADHEEASVTADLAAWWPHVRLGGVLSGDDYGHQYYGGVTVAWDQFDRQMGGLHREGLVWVVKAADAPYLPIVELVLRETTCASCNRAIFDAHVDGEGRCSLCALPPAQPAIAARPAVVEEGIPRLSTEYERTWTDLGRPVEEH
jgi:hypothetical protein